MNKYSTGTTENRPDRNLYAGFEYFNTSLKVLQIYNGTLWNDVFMGNMTPSSIDERNPGIYSLYSESQPQPGDNLGYGNVLVVLGSLRNNFTSGIQLFIGGKDERLYIRSFKGSDFTEWTVLYNPLLHIGTTGQRPADTSRRKKDIGFQYFDTTLGRPIWWNGSAWVDATGQTV